MITPNDIAVKEFKKSAVGYSPEEVDAFLDEIRQKADRNVYAAQKTDQRPDNCARRRECGLAFDKQDDEQIHCTA